MVKQLTQRQLSQRQEINSEKLFMRQFSRLSGPLEGMYIYKCVYAYV
jgi:hypothetical protein